MHISNRTLQTIVVFLIFAAFSTTVHTLPQTGPEKEKANQQEKKPDEKQADTNAQDGIQILSDTMGFDFGPYMKRLKLTVEHHWEAVIPDVALPPIKKSGMVKIELKVMKDGSVMDMKLVKSSGDAELDKAAWGGITNASPLPALPSGFKGDHLKLRCNFNYNPAVTPAREAKQDPGK